MSAYHNLGRFCVYYFLIVPHSNSGFIHRPILFKNLASYNLKESRKLFNFNYFKSRPKDANQTRISLCAHSSKDRMTVSASAAVVAATAAYDAEA